MGKKNRHSQDRLFITATEWKREYGGKKDAASKVGRPLPFDHCAMSLAPYENPVCTAEGVVFDIENLLPYLQTHKCNPVTGEPMSGKDVIRLHMFKNADGKWHCPVSCKVFNDNSHIVAIKTTGNVFSFEVVNELNIKLKQYSDLLTSEPFQRSDIITLQDPTNAEVMARRDIGTFIHLNQMRAQHAASEESGKKIRTNTTADAVIKEMDRLKACEEDSSTKFKAMETSVAAAIASREYVEDVRELLALQALTSDVNPGQASTSGKAGSALTSSSSDYWTANSVRLATAEELREARWRKLRQIAKKGYVRLHTNLGSLNLELHCDMAQRACWNFITLCSRGYYDNTLFHRLIPGFMVQGGDPTGTGSGGDSAWGYPFKDEFDSRLWHDTRGVLSMANSGSNSNGSQFFITFKDARNLDNKHAVFGRLVGGAATLAQIEAQETDKKDRPLAPITISRAEVISSPYAEADAALLADIRANMTRRINSAPVSALPSTQSLSVSGSGAGGSAVAAGVKVGEVVHSEVRPLKTGVVDDSVEIVSLVGKRSTAPDTTASSSSLTSSAASASEEEVRAFRAQQADYLKADRAAVVTSASQSKKTKSFGDFSSW